MNEVDGRRVVISQRCTDAREYFGEIWVVDQRHRRRESPRM